MYKYRWNLSKTIAFLTFKRIVAKPNDGFMQQLKDVERKLNIQSETHIQTNSRAQKILNPRSSGSYHESYSQPRPGSAREIPLA